jgi:hypothetical protein
MYAQAKNIGLRFAMNNLTMSRSCLMDPLADTRAPMRRVQAVQDHHLYGPSRCNL